ncbi:MAG TPA: CocE/NonD family hydrolase [Solirubrobacteraceae bacterium]|nr:CocE/NonD family hydrolase [Solirubrobacteraceae bacterium]
MTRRLAALTALALTALAVPAVPATAASGRPVARGSVEQVDVTGARPGARVRLLSRAGRTIAVQRAGALGGVVFRGVRPGSGYRVQDPGRTADPGAVTVLPNRSAPPSGAIYRQRLPKGGYGYLTTRDGTKLAIDVHLPAGGGTGPWPTLVEYSGYGYADPQGAEHSISQVANLLGYAVVDVNMRGTGCSGGAFDFFEPLQGLDGYDVIQTVASQPWALHHKVGMMGISYGGISQLFVAATRPPALAAITPLSVIDQTLTTLYPGGLLNTGFALSWAKDRVHDAKPASATGGQAWALQRIKGGDAVCKANQVLHTAAVDLIAKTKATRFYDPKVADPLAPTTFVHRIGVPVFLACQFTDEQTGGHCPELAGDFTGTRRKWFTFTNGTHIDSLDPATFDRWYDFLELYVARRPPNLSSSLKALAPAIFSAAMGIPNVTLPDDPIQGRASYADALSAFQAIPPVRVLFDNGAGGSVPGAPYASFEHAFGSLPAPGTQARSWYLGADGALADAPPASAGADAFTWNPAARSATSFTGDTASGPGGLWTATPTYHWQQDPPGTALSYLTAPLSADTTVLGAGALQAWIQSSAPRVDLQVSVSEVRPDGQETFVQNGWLRTSARKLDPRKSTLLGPVPTFTKADDAPLPAGRWSEIDVPLYYEGHVYRAGSRIRVTITAPGGDQPVWAFAALSPKGTATVSLAHSADKPSRLILPVVPGIGAPTPLPPCPGLRGEACRPYVPLENQAATAKP